MAKSKFSESSAPGKRKNANHSSKGGRSRGYAKSNESKFRQEKLEFSDPRPNDPAWYAKNSAILDTVASYSFNSPVGAGFTIEAESFSDLSMPNSATLYDPGIMTIFTTPAIGTTVTASATAYTTSPANIAATNLYAAIRRNISGSRQYDPADLMLYLMAYDSAVSYYATMMRWYGIANTFAQDNRYVPEAILSATGITTAIVKSLAEFRGYINSYATRLSALAMPTNMTVIRRHMWMYGSYFKDAPTNKSQFFAYAPGFLWKYVESDGAGHLAPTPIGSTLDQTAGYIKSQILSLSNVVTTGEGFLSALLNSEDIGTISGDILRTFGNGGIWTFSPVPENYTVVPIYSPEVLSQIHNTDFAGIRPCNSSGTIGTDSLQLYQSIGIDGQLEFTPRFLRVPNLSYTSILDFHSVDHPSPADVMVATRNKLAGHTTSIVIGSGSTATTEYLTEIEACGSEICLYPEISYFTVSGSSRILTKDKITLASGYSSNTVTNYSKFSNAPIWFNVSPTYGSIVTPPSLSPLGSLDNFTLLHNNDIRRIHESALLSMFDVPYLGG